MKTNHILLFFVSLAAVLMSGCASSYHDGALTLTTPHQPHGTYMETRSGVLDHSDVFVTNPYPELRMKVSVAVGALYETGWSSFHWIGYEPTPMGNSFRARPPCMVVGKEAVLVGVEWFDAEGRSAGKSSQVFNGLGHGTSAWHVQAYPRIGQMDRYCPVWPTLF